ncbi:MAG: hypothetical protein N2201_07200 [candidate division WOR-3 bacterium]|nr:hypothetical protein [candidate division WOR-3 bacterium]
MLKKKLNWLNNTMRVFGNCGMIVYINRKSVGYAQYAPSAHLPKSSDYPSGPPSADAVLISCIFIPQKEFRGIGIGSILL